jgi:hypothetical protein
MDSCIRSRLKHPEESLCGLDIASDLLAQQLRRIEPPLIPHALQKLKAQPRSARRDRCIQHERFDRLRIAVKGGACADVGDGMDKRAAIERRSRDVDALARHEFIVRFQVQSRDSHIPAASLACGNAAFDFKPAA